MWEKKKSGKDYSNDDQEKQADGLMAAVKKLKDRDLYESELYDFMRNARFGFPIPNNQMQFVADTVEQLMSGKNAVRVSDILGKRPKGSRGKKSLEKKKQHRRIAEFYALNKLQGMSRNDNLEATAEECGVTTRTIENVIQDYASQKPFFSYGTDEKI